ncbi:PH domain-containing protein [Myroides sp. LJL119]
MKAYRLKVPLFPAILLLIPVINILFVQEKTHSLSTFSIILLFSSGCLLLLYINSFFKSRCVINNNELHIFEGFFNYNKTIDIANITRIEKIKSKKLFKSKDFAPVKIYFNKFDSVILTITNQEDFISILRQLNSKITLTN